MIKRLLNMLQADEKQEPARTSIIYPDDTFLVSYPRSGNAWLRRLIAVMQDPTRDPQAPDITHFVPMVDSEEATQAPRPRIIKSHQAYESDYPRVIYLVRDGRDVAVSYYNFHRTIHEYKDSFEEFLELFVNGDLMFGAWHEHVSGWLFRDEAIPSSIRVDYEQLHAEPTVCLQRIADFMNWDIKPESIQIAVEKCTFQAQQEYVKRHSKNYTKGYRGGVKGGPGAWRDWFTSETEDLYWRHAGATMEALGHSREGS